MYIRSVAYMPDELKGNDLTRYGIEKAYRQLYIFIDKNDYINNTLTMGKAIQINLAAQVGINDEVRNRILGISKSNSTMIISSVYYYDVVFTPQGIDDLLGANFTLNNAHATEIVNDFDKNVINRFDLSLYNRLVSVSGNVEESMGILSNSFLSETHICNPKYYSYNHQYNETKDLVSLIWNEYTLVFEGDDLIDSRTGIEVYDLSTWDTMVPALKQQIDDLGSLPSTNTASIISGMFAPTVESVIDHFVYIYDTEKGIGVQSVPGKTKVPLSDYRIKQSVVNDLDYIKDQLMMEAKRIEKEHGSIRLYYVPKISGDKIEVNFKDYNKDSVVPGFNNLKVDKSYSAEELLSSHIMNSDEWNVS